MPAGIIISNNISRRVSGYGLRVVVTITFSERTMQSRILCKQCVKLIFVMGLIFSGISISILVLR